MKAEGKARSFHIPWQRPWNRTRRWRSLSWGALGDLDWGPHRFIPMELQLVGGHVRYGLSICSWAGESAVDALVQGGELVKHSVHHRLSVSKECKVISVRVANFSEKKKFKYSWFAVLISTVQQSDSVIHIYSFFPIFFSIMVYHRSLNEFPVLYGRILFILSVYNCICWSPMPSPSPRPHLAQHRLFSVCEVCFCLAAMFICHILDSTYKWYHMVSVFLSLTVPNLIISRSIHIAANGIISFFF